MCFQPAQSHEGNRCTSIRQRSRMETVVINQWTWATRSTIQQAPFWHNSRILFPLQQLFHPVRLLMVTTMKLLPICHSVPSTNCNLTPSNYPPWCDSPNNFTPNTKPKCTRPHSRSICCHKIHTRPLRGARCLLKGSTNLCRGIHKEGDVGARHFHGQFGGFQSTPTLWGKRTPRQRAISWSGVGCIIFQKRAM